MFGVLGNIWDALDDFVDDVQALGEDFAEALGFGDDEVQMDEMDAIENEIIDITDIPQIGEAQFADLDGDGYNETAILQMDTDYDGVADSTYYVTQVDTDFDGLADEFIEMVDFGSDGTVDLINRFADTDHDGVLDYFSQEIGIDTTGDGIADISMLSEDLGYDGTIDNVTEFDLTITDGAGVMAEDTYENFDPNDYDPNTVVGDPVENMGNWHMQEDGGSCAVVSQEMVLEYITGEEFSEADLCSFANEMGWFEYGPNGGTLPEDVGNILVALGLEVSQSYGNDEQDLHEALVNGESVIVAVDADELWEGDNDFGPGDGANHAIQVIGIDYSDPDDPMVIINDSGVPDGAGALVPLDVFVDAWEDSGNFMVTAY